MVADFTFQNTKSTSATRRSQFMYFGLMVILVKLLLLGGNKKIRGDAFWEAGKLGRHNLFQSCLGWISVFKVHKIQGLMKIRTQIIVVLIVGRMIKTA